LEGAATAAGKYSLVKANYRLAAGRVSFRPLDPFPGHQTGQERAAYVYELLEAAGVASGQGAWSGGLLVYLHWGEQRECEAIKECFEIAAGRGAERQLSSVYGDAGVGKQKKLKSRLSGKFEAGKTRRNQHGWEGDVVLYNQKP